LPSFPAVSFRNFPGVCINIQGSVEYGICDIEHKLLTPRKYNTAITAIIIIPMVPELESGRII